MRATLLFAVLLWSAACSGQRTALKREPTPARCRTDKPCSPPGRFCVDGRCSSCRHDRDCNAKNVCQRCDRAKRRCVAIEHCCSFKKLCKTGRCIIGGGTLFGFCGDKGPEKQLCPKGQPCPRYPKCTLDAHCRHKKQFCVGGLCRSCRTDAQCANLGIPCLRCAPPKYVCLRIPQCCGSAMECRGTNMLCVKSRGATFGRCKPGCLNDSVCGIGQFCDQGICRDKIRRKP